MPESKTNSPTPLPVEALKLLRGFGRRHRLLAAARGAAAWTISVILFVLPALALDRFLLLETPARLTISWVVLVVAGAVARLRVGVPCELTAAPVVVDGPAVAVVAGKARLPAVFAGRRHWHTFGALRRRT